ncbi:MAG: hypothetical protein U1E76_04715 [Planctomycetota bacterium]
MRILVSLGLGLVATGSLGCGPRSVPNPAATLFEPIDVPDALGFLWAGHAEQLADLTGAARPDLDLPLVPDQAMLRVVHAEGFDRTRPAAIVLVDPQVFGASIAYAFGITSEAEFLRGWRRLDGMQEASGEPLHFFATHRTLKLTSGSFLGLPQAEVKRRDYHLRFRDGYVVVLPSKDAEHCVEQVLERFHLRGGQADRISEFLSVDVDALVRAHSDYLAPLRELMQRMAGQLDGSEQQKLLVVARDVAQWTVERIMAVDHLWLARDGTSLSAKVAVKPGSRLREDARLLSGSLDQPFDHLPHDATSACDLVIEPAHGEQLVRTFLPLVPDLQRPVALQIAGHARRIQWGGGPEGFVQLIDLGSEASARAVGNALGVATDASVPTEIDLARGAWLLPSAESLGQLWFAARDGWVALGRDEAYLRRALADASHPAPAAHGWSAEMLAGAVALLQVPMADGTSFLARLAVRGDELLLDGKQVER